MSGQSVLHPHHPDQDPATVAWLNSDDLRASFGLRRVVTLDGHRQWLHAADDVLLLAIMDGKGVHVGNTLLKMNRMHRSGYFQIYIGVPEARGHGIGRAALAGMLARGFDEHGLHRIWLHTFPENVRAEALYRSIGFVHEGVERDAICADGHYVSQNRWSLLEHEWRAVR